MAFLDAWARGDEPRDVRNRAQLLSHGISGVQAAWLGVENGGSADAWIAQQAAYDLWKARAAGVPAVQRAPEVAAA